MGIIFLLMFADGQVSPYYELMDSKKEPALTGINVEGEVGEYTQSQAADFALTLAHAKNEVQNALYEWVLNYSDWHFYTEPYYGDRLNIVTLINNPDGTVNMIELRVDDEELWSDLKSGALAVANLIKSESIKTRFVHFSESIVRTLNSRLDPEAPIEDRIDAYYKSFHPMTAEDIGIQQPDFITDGSEAMDTFRQMVHAELIEQNIYINTIYELEPAEVDEESVLSAFLEKIKKEHTRLVVRRDGVPDSFSYHYLLDTYEFDRDEWTEEEIETFATRIHAYGGGIYAHIAARKIESEDRAKPLDWKDELTQQAYKNVLLYETDAITHLRHSLYTLEKLQYVKPLSSATLHNIGRLGLKPQALTAETRIIEENYLLNPSIEASLGNDIEMESPINSVRGWVENIEKWKVLDASLGKYLIYTQYTPRGSILFSEIPIRDDIDQDELSLREYAQKHASISITARITEKTVRLLKMTENIEGEISHERLLLLVHGLKPLESNIIQPGTVGGVVYLNNG